MYKETGEKQQVNEFNARSIERLNIFIDVEATDGSILGETINGLISFHFKNILGFFPQTNF